MGLVLWIDQNTFAIGLLEKVFKKKNIPFYTLSQVSDFSYLVDDLCPSLLVLDRGTLEEDLSAFRSQYEFSVKMQALPVILIDADPESFPFIKNVLGQIQRPFDPFEIPARLEDFLGVN